MWRPLGLLIFFLVFVSCGKNEGIRPVGYYPGPMSPYPQAPPPPMGTFPRPPGPIGQPGMPYFQPQAIPQGYGPSFYPFLPIYSYMQQRPQLNVYWIQIWNGWQNYSQNSGCGQYDFSCFWRDYCPNVLGNSPLYNYFDQNVYYWVQPDTQFLPSADPGYFWQSYDWMPYSNIDISVCSSGC